MKFAMQEIFVGVGGIRQMLADDMNAGIDEETFGAEWETFLSTRESAARDWNVPDAAIDSIQGAWTRCSNHEGDVWGVDAESLGVAEEDLGIGVHLITQKVHSPSDLAWFAKYNSKPGELKHPSEYMIIVGTSGMMGRECLCFWVLEKAEVVM